MTFDTKNKKGRKLTLCLFIFSEQNNMIFFFAFVIAMKWNHMTRWLTVYKDNSSKCIKNKEILINEMNNKQKKLAKIKF